MSHTVLRRSRFSVRLRSVRTAVLLGSVALLGTACDDAEEEDEPEIQAVQLTVTPPSGVATSYVLRASGVQGGPIQLRVGANRVSAVGLDASNQRIDLESDFELRLVGGIQGESTTPLPAGFEFTRNGTLSSTLTVSTAAVGARTVALQMFHRGENHSDFDVPSVSVNVAP